MIRKIDGRNFVLMAVIAALVTIGRFSAFADGSCVVEGFPKLRFWRC
jgi:hypothetical protein